jgi:hypothetical protein
MIKSSLSSHQQVRDLNAAAFDAYQYETESELGMLMTTKGQNDAQKARELSRDEVAKTLGPPHVHFVNTFIKWLLSQEIGANNRTALTTVMDSCKESWVALHDICSFVKTAKCYDGAYRKLFFAAAPQLRTPIVEAIKQTSMTLLSGRAPRGAMERELGG